MLKIEKVARVHLGSNSLVLDTMNETIDAVNKIIDYINKTIDDKGKKNVKIKKSRQSKHES